jgi:hypothetical protein
MFLVLFRGAPALLRASPLPRRDCSPSPARRARDGAWRSWRGGGRNAPIRSGGKRGRRPRVLDCARVRRRDEGDPAAVGRQGRTPRGAAARREGRSRRPRSGAGRHSWDNGEHAAPERRPKESGRERPRCRRPPFETLSQACPSRTWRAFEKQAHAVASGQRRPPDPKRRIGPGRVPVASVLSFHRSLTLPAASARPGLSQA